MPTIPQVIDNIQNSTYSKVTQSDIARVLGITRATISARVKTGSQITLKEREKLEQAYNVDLSPKVEPKSLTLEEIKTQIKEIKEKLNIPEIPQDIPGDIVAVTYRPNVYLSAGYGVEVSDENATTMILDNKIFVSDRGCKINPSNCEIVRVSGNSMEPEYRHGDRVIIDKSDTQLLDGHIYAIRYKGECYVKEINLTPDKIICLSLNPKYEPFAIDKHEDFKVLGRILPRVRL